jgi:hypothetical protein
MKAVIYVHSCNVRSDWNRNATVQNLPEHNMEDFIVPNDIYSTINSKLTNELSSFTVPGFTKKLIVAQGKNMKILILSLYFISLTT